MATQTVEFRSPPSQTVTAKLFAVGSDTQVAAVAATEATNRKGTYAAAYTDVPAGLYEMIAFVGAIPVARWFVKLTLATATFQAREPVDITLGTPAGDSISADIAAVKAVIILADTTIAALTSQIVFTLTAGSADNDAYNSMMAVITDQATAVQKAVEIVSDYVGSTKTVTLRSAPAFTIAAGDLIQIVAVGSVSESSETLEAVAADLETLLGLSGAATIPPNGYVDGIAESLIIGDDYTEDLNRLVTLSLVDSAGDPADTSWGSYSLADGGISIQLLLRPSGKVSGAAEVVGTCAFVAASGSVPAKLNVTLPRTQTILADPGSYDMQAEAVWSDGTTRTFLPFGKVTFVKNIARS